jgi:hypothetical protein
MLHQTKDEEIGFGTRGKWIDNDVQVGKNIIVPLDDFDDPFGLCWLPNVYMCFKKTCWMDGTTNTKHEMLSSMDIGMKGFNKGVGTIFLEMTSQ